MWTCGAKGDVLVAEPRQDMAEPADQVRVMLQVWRWKPQLRMLFWGCVQGMEHRAPPTLGK